MKMIKWCNLVHSECSKVCYYQQHPRFRAIFFSKINQDAHVSTKMKTITYYKGVGGLGAITPESQRNVKKWMLFLSMYDVDSDSC